ncbi:MAG: hypothetical protein RL839_05350 [Gammaproteobacteria bacterium]
MAVTTFDTLKFVRRLEQVGVPSEQAEVQAEVLTEAFNVNLEELVTKDYLTAEFAKERAYTDTRFEAVNVKFAELNAKFTLLYWMNGLIILVTVVPALQRLIAY